MSLRTALTILIVPLLLNAGLAQASLAAPMHCDSHAGTLESPPAHSGETSGHGQVSEHTPCDPATHCEIGCCAGAGLASMPLMPGPPPPFRPPAHESASVGGGSPSDLLRPPDT